MTTINWLFCYRVVVVLVIHFQKRLLFFFFSMRGWVEEGKRRVLFLLPPFLFSPPPFSPPSPSSPHHLRHRHLRPRPAVGPGMNDLFPPAGFSSLVFLDASFEIVAVQDFAIRRFATTGVHLKQAQDAVARVWKEKERESGKGSEKGRGKESEREEEKGGKGSERKKRWVHWTVWKVPVLLCVQHNNTTTQQHNNTATQQHKQHNNNGQQTLLTAPPRRSNAAIGPVAQEFGDFAALGFVAGAATALVARRVVDQRFQKEIQAALLGCRKCRKCRM